MTARYFTIPNLERLQNRADRGTLPWMKLYIRESGTYAMGRLSDAEKWIKTAFEALALNEPGHRLPMDWPWLRGKLGLTSKSNPLPKLLELGFIVEVESPKDLSRSIEDLPVKRVTGALSDPEGAPIDTGGNPYRTLIDTLRKNSVSAPSATFGDAWQQADGLDIDTDIDIDIDNNVMRHASVPRPKDEETDVVHRDNISFSSTAVDEVARHYCTVWNEPLSYWKPGAICTVEIALKTYTVDECKAAISAAKDQPSDFFRKTKKNRQPFLILNRHIGQLLESRQIA